MTIQVAVNHQTKYEYDRLISLLPHVFRLKPAVYSRTPVKAYSLTICPGKHFINWQQDPFGNFLARVVFPEKTRELYIELDLVAEMTVINPLLSQRLFEAIRYTIRMEPGVQTCEETLKKMSGSCRDQAWFLVQILRHLGLAARYVNGYIETIPPPGKEELKGADVSHAWFSVFLPDWGWVDFDPTNKLVLSEQHIVIAWGRDFSDVTPVKGVVFSGGGHN
jgi:transglutaminase-like putative cysteine protease